MDFQTFRSRLIRLFILGLAFGSFIGCGYSFQNTRNPLKTQEGVEKIYVSPLLNNTYKAGVESVVYNNLIRVLASHRRVEIVKSLKEADASLDGVIVGASYVGISGTHVSDLSPGGVGQGLPTSGFAVSSIYSATLICSFSLNRRKELPNKSSLLWSSTFSRNKPFAAANQLDVPGTTSPLINESEFERAIGDLARSMMDDVHESMLALF